MVKRASALLSTSRWLDTGVTSSTSSVPASSSPASRRAPRPIAWMMNSAGSRSVNSSAFMNPSPVVIASMSNRSFM